MMPRASSAIPVAQRVSGFSYAIRNIVAEARKLEAAGRKVRYLNIGDPIIFGFRTPTHMERLWENTRFFKEGLVRLGFDTGISESPITPVIAGDSAKANQLSDRLFEAGVFAQAIVYPTVARDRARVRTIVTATHTRDDLQYALDAFARVGRQIGLI